MKCLKQKQRSPSAHKFSSRSNVVLLAGAVWVVVWSWSIHGNIRKQLQNKEENCISNTIKYKETDWERYMEWMSVKWRKKAHVYENFIFASLGSDDVFVEHFLSSNISHTVTISINYLQLLHSLPGCLPSETSPMILWLLEQVLIDWCRQWVPEVGLRVVSG